MDALFRTRLGIVIYAVQLVLLLLQIASLDMISRAYAFNNHRPGWPAGVCEPILH